MQSVCLLDDGSTPASVQAPGSVAHFQSTQLYGCVFARVVTSVIIACSSNPCKDTDMQPKHMHYLLMLALTLELAVSILPEVKFKRMTSVSLEVLLAQGGLRLKCSTFSANNLPCVCLCSSSPDSDS